MLKGGKLELFWFLFAVVVVDERRDSERGTRDWSTPDDEVYRCSV